MKTKQLDPRWEQGGKMPEGFADGRPRVRCPSCRQPVPIEGDPKSEIDVVDRAVRTHLLDDCEGVKR